MKKLILLVALAMVGCGDEPEVCLAGCMCIKAQASCEAAVGCRWTENVCENAIGGDAGTD